MRIDTSKTPGNQARWRAFLRETCVIDPWLRRAIGCEAFVAAMMVALP